VNLTWDVARAGGLVAWGLATASVVWGLALSTKLAKRRPWPAWLLDMHRFLGALAVVFTVVHVGAVLLDSYTNFSLAAVFVPFVATWHPTAVAWGIVAFYALVAVEVTSLLKPRIGRTWWRRTHYLSFALFAFSTLHAVMAGTDTRSALVLTALAVASVPVFALVSVRLGAPRLPARPSAVAGAKPEQRLPRPTSRRVPKVPSMEPRPDLPRGVLVGPPR
jgi:DMSO/TMAO reductase YedYZ heme-binding membrane subunit